MRESRGDRSALSAAPDIAVVSVGLNLPGLSSVILPRLVENAAIP